MIAKKLYGVALISSKQAHLDEIVSRSADKEIGLFINRVPAQFEVEYEWETYYDEVVDNFVGFCMELEATFRMDIQNHLMNGHRKLIVQITWAKCMWIMTQLPGHAAKTSNQQSVV